MEGIVKSKRNKAWHLMRIVMMLSMVAIVMPMMVHGAAGFPTIPVSQLNSSEIPMDMTFTYVLEPSESDSPMPLGSIGGEFVFTLNGESTTELVFPENMFEGHFVYTLSQIVDEEREGVIYDKRDYRIELFVDEVGDTNVFVFCDDGQKTGEVVFENDTIGVVNPSPKEDPKPVPTSPAPTPPTPTKPSLPIGPTTGDITNLWLEIAGVIAALSIFLIVAVARKKKSKKDKDLSDL
jgi:LPXTG-motif cell wall-anchored protein